jgi:putative effector of murein hydrolase
LSRGPLYRNRELVRRDLLPVTAALVTGAIVAIASALIVAKSLGAVLVSLATGILGAIVLTPPMNGLGIRDYAARGFAVGLASHGIGTARAFSIDPVAGAFAGLAMGLNAVVNPALIPALLPWLTR